MSRYVGSLAWHLAPMLVGLSVASPPASAQAIPTANALAPYKPLRFDEDWRDWCAARPADAEPTPKCIGIADDVLLTIGGDLRERVELVDEPRFGLTQPSDQAFLHRILVHGDVRFGQSIRGFVQLGFFESSGRRQRAPATDVNRLDLTQAFVDLNFTLAEGSMTIRPGRQEVAVGASRLISVRNGPNVRLSFDGVRTIYVGKNLRADAFYLRPVETEQGAFDDPTSDQRSVWGGYLTLPGPARGAIDLYYLGFRNKQARFSSIAGREVRHSLGARVSGAGHRWDWDAEAVAQFGELGGQSIRAWTLATSTGYTFPAPLRPRLGIKANIASGDAKPGDDKLGTFNALFPRLPYFSEAALFAPANFFDLHPTLAIQPARNLTLSAGWNRLWRHRRADAIYLAPLTAVMGTAGQQGRSIGAQWIAGVEWRPAPAIRVDAQYVHFRPGGALRQVGADNGDFFMASVNLQV